MVRERRGKKSKSKDVEEVAPPVVETLQVPEEPAINRFFKREKSPFEVGDRKELQVASSHAIIDKACVMDISGGGAKVAAKVDEYINLLFTDYCALDQASCGDISKEIKIVVIEEESDPTVINPDEAVIDEETKRIQEEENARLAAIEAEAARIKAERLAEEKRIREEQERLAQEEADRVAAEEAEKKRIEEEEAKKKAIEEEKAKKKAEAEAKKKAEEELEKAKKEAEELARAEAEAIAKAEAEKLLADSDNELIPPKEEDGINWEAVEEEPPLVPDVLVDLLEKKAEEEGTEEVGDEVEKEMTERDRDLEWQRQRQMMRPPLVISHLKSRAVPTGSIAKLTCNVSGPGLIVRWFKNGNPIELKPEKYQFFNSEGLLSLEIKNIKKRDAGDYSCCVKNKNGETETIANITVYDNDIERPTPPTFVTIKDENPPPPVEEKIVLDKWGDPIKPKRKIRPLSLRAQNDKFEFTVHLHDVTVVEDRNARFICGVNSYSKNLEISWFKDDKRIRFKLTPRILDYSRAATACIGIECTNLNDAGEYKCIFEDKDSGQILETSCRLIVVPRIKRTKELARRIPPAFVRKLAYTYNELDDELTVHCTILANPEPDIKWYVKKVPLHLCPLPRVKIFTHPDSVHEHIVASLVILGPTYRDNGEYVIEVTNDAGFERRVVNVQFQTEDEYNDIVYRRYMAHKEHFKLHEYGPNEERWEDVIPEVREFHPYIPEVEGVKAKVSASGTVRKRRKKHRLIKKKIMMPWGEEEEHEVTDSNASSESYSGNEEENEPEVEEDEGWGPPETPPEEEPFVEEEPVEEQPSTDEPLPEEIPVEEVPVEEPKIEETPVVEETPIVEETPVEETPAEEVTVEEPKVEEEPTEEIVEEAWPTPEVDPYADLEEPQEIIYYDDYHPIEIARKLADPDYPRLLRKPKFYITDFQLKKKFFMVNKLVDVELVKGKTLRLESISASMGPVTAEWRFNGRLIGNTHRRTIEFYPRRNFTSIEIENTRVQDSGNYTVTFYNNFTEPLIDTCKVNIIVPKPLEVADQPPTFTRLLTGINHHYRFIKLPPKF